MRIGKLSSLQVRVLELAAGIDPPWTLTGGGALAGFHTKHRETRDLDLFFRGQRELGERPADVRRRLEDGGLAVTVLRTAAMFSQLQVSDATDRVVVDLVAHPTPIAESPQPTDLGGLVILVETRHQLFVNKLCALLSRSELRDLVDARVLMEAGEDLARGLADAPRQDAGFSPLTLSWSLQNLQVRKLATALEWPSQDAETLDAFRLELIDRVLADASPPPQ